MRKNLLEISKGKTGSSLGRILILLLTIQIFIAVTITSFISYVNSLKTIDEFAFQILDQTADEVEDELFYFQEIAEMVNQINIDSTELGLLDIKQKTSLERYFYNQLELFEYVNLISVGTEDGAYIGLQRNSEIPDEYIFAFEGEDTNRSLELWKSDEGQNNYELFQEQPDYDPRIRPWYIAAVENDGPVFSPIYAHASTGEFLISASQAFYSEEGVLEGVFSTNLTLAYFEKYLSALSVGKSGQVFIIEPDGLLVAASEPVPLYLPSDGGFERLLAAESENSVIADAVKYYSTGFESFKDIPAQFQKKINLDNNPYYLQIVPFSVGENLDWIVFILIPQNDFMGQIRQNAFQTLILIIGALIFSIFVGIITAQWVANPIINLNTAAKSIAQGKWIQPVYLDRDDEIGELTQSFNQMAAQLQDSFSSLEKQIAEQKKIEDALRESEEKFRLIIENANEGIVLFDHNGTILEVNLSAAGFAKIPREDLLNKNVSKLMGELKFAIESAQKALKDCIEGRPIIGMQTKIVAKDGIERIIRGNLMPVRKDEEIIGVSMVVEDITDSVKAAEEMVYLRRLLANILDSMPSFMIGINEDRRVTHWNRQIQVYTGLEAEEVLGKDLKEVLPQLFKRVPLLDQKLLEKKLLKQSKIIWEDKKVVHYFDITLYPLLDEGYSGTVIRLDNVTEQMQKEEMLIQSEKMMSVGGLAAGMAHEINNPLAGIVQSMQVIQNRLFLNSPKNAAAAKNNNISLSGLQDYARDRGIDKMVENVLDSGKRAASIVNNMLSFSRKSAYKFELYNMAELLDRTVELVSSDYDLRKKYDFRQIKIIRNYAPDIGLIRCEGTKIQQVFLNILKNGAQAMASKDYLDETPAFIFRLFKDGDFLKIEIEDNGPGMDIETRKRVFEPFFTTKNIGEGVGLGLSVSYFIITENHNGIMTVESVLGSGTKFLIGLPLQ